MIEDAEATLALDMDVIANDAEDEIDQEKTAENDGEENLEKTEEMEIIAGNSTEKNTTNFDGESDAENDAEEEVDDDGEALITKKEWKQVVKRIAKLEALVYSLSQTEKKQQQLQKKPSATGQKAPVAGQKPAPVAAISSAQKLTTSSATKKRPAEDAGTQPAKKFKST